MWKASVVVLLYFICLPVKADWAVFSVSSLCDAKENTFSLEPLFETSEPSFFMRAPNKRFTKLTEGIDRNLKCRLKSGTVSLKYTAVGSQASGMCRGRGFVSINLLQIDKKRITGGDIINSGCFSDETLVSLKIHVNSSKIAVERCTVTGWSWEHSYEGKLCNTSNFSR